MNKEPFVNPYLLLNISSQASPEEIKQAYLHLVKLYHPDKNQGNKIAEKKFQQLNRAWELLKDPAKKQLLDQELAIREENRLRLKKPKKLEEKGIDLECQLKVSLEDICQNRSKSLQYLRPRSHVQEKHSFVIQLPKGIKEGSRLFFKGRGGAKGRKKFGDLYVGITVRPHKLFKPIGSSFDLIIEQPLSFVSAFLAEKFESLSPYGFLFLEPKKPVRQGELFQLKNQGLFKNKRGDRGDLFVKITIDYPLDIGLKVKNKLKQLSGTQKSLYVQNMKKQNLIYPEVLKFKKKLEEIKRKYYS